MRKLWNGIKEYIKGAIWLIPVLLTTIFCIYFINLFQRIDDAQIKRQIDERDTIVEFAHFIKTRSTLYRYSDIIDRFDDNNLYLLDQNADCLKDKAHTRNCPYSLYKVQHPYKQEPYKSEMIKHYTGDFVHKVRPGMKMYFKYRHLEVENEKFILLVGVHSYPKLPEERELHYAIGLLLLFTAVSNWIIVAYAKHMRKNCIFKN